VLFAIKPGEISPLTNEINKTMKATRGQMRSGFTLVELLVVISIIVVLAGLSVPVAMKALGKAEQVTGINNVGNIKKAMDLFASDFDGEYPSDDTGAELMDIMDDNAGSGRSRDRGLGGRSRLNASRDLGARGERREVGSDKPSNYYFNQLMGRGLDNEELSYAKAFKKAFRVTKPDNDQEVDAGECVWAYTKRLQQTSASHIPIVYDTPWSTGESPEFNKRVWDGKIIVAKLDNSTGTEIIGGTDKIAGRVTGKVDGERVNLFSQFALEEGELTPADLEQFGGGN
jgi:prepilin-type N-terminal cleavage/methylation domain-containing protein